MRRRRVCAVAAISTRSAHLLCYQWLVEEEEGQTAQRAVLSDSERQAWWRAHWAELPPGWLQVRDSVASAAALQHLPGMPGLGGSTADAESVLRAHPAHRGSRQDPSLTAGLPSNGPTDTSGLSHAPSNSGLAQLSERASVLGDRSESTPYARVHTRPGRPHMGGMWSPPSALQGLPRAVGR